MMDRAGPIPKHKTRVSQVSTLYILIIMSKGFEVGAFPILWNQINHHEFLHERVVVHCEGCLINLAFTSGTGMVLHLSHRLIKQVR
ncbi:hypothetical protein CROQUDRAFT_225962 [Cronartium quercuum f. sp. fusiforme G11]|uniref:Uncharacterized protein n=1 Tax=Cronartium quercuum f. sp. fusiforme G11 TaxID=708437 RepID=A0A9P6NF22_9BASI|nr:hypothetical protein CROQUDRAFT_225962 [Cronartium quercuum f. sp. fusiforme G11]